MILLSLLLAIDLRLELVRESLTGTHYRYRQYVGESAVVGGEVNVTVFADGTRQENGAPASAGALGRLKPALHSVFVNVDGLIRSARREVDGLRVRYYDLQTNELIREELPFANAKPARVFDPNPVAKLNDPSLRDQNDSPAAVPQQAYDTVELLDVNPLGALSGPFVKMAENAVQGSESLLFNRNERGFEDVNAYFHIDGSQRYLQTLGYAGNRTIAPYQVGVDAHATSSDASFYVATTPGQGRLLFGEGGTDDAEDSDLLIHEYAHVIHDWISPGTFLLAFNTEARAISEGFGDYWAFSSTYEKTIASGRDPACIADWDARCDGANCGYPPGADCLRRVDSTKRMADFVNADSSGTEHRNGEIWSSALRELFFAVGRRTTDTLVVESLFGTPPNPSFATMARKMIAADRILYGGANRDAICAVMSNRGILTDCLVAPRGELTFIQGRDRGVRLPDNDPAGITLSTFVSDTRLIERLFVNVQIAHESRGDLQISLIAPDGREIVLQNASLDRTRDLNAIYGRDALPAESLDVLRGRSAAGEWKLRVIDARPLDRGEVLSWSLVIQFQGDTPLAERPLPTGRRQFIPAATHAPGANGTYWVTDLRLFNRESRDVTATVIFTPQFPSDFAAIQVVVPRDEVVALDDVVGVALQTAGGGWIEVAGDVIAASRTYTRTERGSYGQFVPATSLNSAVARSSHIANVRNDTHFRSNIGVAEVAGVGGLIDVIVIDAESSRILEANAYRVEPFGHFQVPVREQEERLTVEVSVRGNSRVVPYASVIDNRTGDPIFVLAEQRGPGTRVAAAPMISGPGAAGTSWRSDVWLMRMPGTATTGFARLTIIDAATGQRFVRDIDPPPPGRAYVFEDFFRGVVDREGLGLLTASLPSGIVLTSRTWTGDETAGTYGQLVTLADTESRGPIDVLFVENSAAYRTNIGVYATDGAAVRVTILDSRGVTLEQRDIFLEPWRVVQFPVTATVINGRARVDVLSGRAVAYGSMVDNVSGDPIFVPGQ